MKKNNIILLVFYFATFIGLYYSKTVLSIFPYVLILYGLAQKGSIQKLKDIFQNRSIVSLMLIFFIYVLSVVNTEHLDVWAEKLNSNLIFIAIPLGTYLLSPFKKSFINKVLILYVLVNFVLNIILLINYFIHFEVVNEHYLRGQTIYTPVMHVRYSYFTVIAILFSIYLTIINIQNKYKFLWGSISLFQIFFLHILAVRTGILSFYLTFIITGVYFAIKYKKYREMLASSILLIIIVTISFLAFPSLKNKIEYSVWDIKSTLNKTAKYHTSDRIRIYSIINGVKLVKEHPFLGTGIGDIFVEMDKKYNENYPDLPAKYRYEPINQFLFTMASMGITGFFLFYGLLLLPVYFTKHKFALLVTFYVMTLSTFIGENTIELILGKTAFLMFLSLFICVEQPK